MEKRFSKLMNGKIGTIVIVGLGIVVLLQALGVFIAISRGY